ncbi:Acetyltransferase (GNAT) domain-containing protein [Polaromonas sp. OV174]|uniref:GNAT family N-acetyltransferase n=1 Tax=Polaromonas sp. OV174 TaxID=1855300 RepID=UPI0008E5CC5C|nr:GNAT family N-acetyltransferase [Polaromonas sp. OV174]SFC33039.1 Acetyltransferase (GNAT) domain-containing protein [Polaromonas sp. OV174]
MLLLAPVAVGDFDEMAALRIEALRESLERLGRFDPVRARERLAAGFVPEHMRHIMADGQRAGYITLRPASGPEPRARQLDHLYIRPDFQGAGIGAWALDWAKEQAKAQDLDITLSALKQSAANRFYLRHGFVQVGESEFDLDYRWCPARGVRA